MLNNCKYCDSSNIRIIEEKHNIVTTSDSRINSSNPIVTTREVNKHYYVECEDCFSATAPHMTIKKAIEEWNND